MYGMSFNALHCITDGLQGVDKDGNTTNALAESVETSDDGLTYTFKIRDDAKWSNGDDVTADDFVFAWQRIIKNAGNYAYMMGSEGAAIKNADELINKGTKATQDELDTLGVKQGDDEKTLVVTLETQIPYFLDLMTFPCYYPQNRAFVEAEGDDYATSPDHLISCGAFTMTEWTNGKSAEFTKNDTYWNADAVSLTTVSMDLVVEPATAASSFDTGDVDYAVISTELVDKYKDSDTYVQFNEGYMFYLEPNHKVEALANENVRFALSYAIDREALCNDVLKDGSQEANGFVPSQLSTSPSGTDFRDDTDDFTAYDVTKAQEYLDAGLKELGKDSITIELLYGTDESPMDKFAEAVQGYWSKLDGLTVEMKATTKQDRINNRMANGEFDIACTRWGPDYSDPTTYLNLMLSGNGNNYGKYNSSEYDDLMKKVQTTSDTTERWNYMVQAEKVAMSTLANIPVFEKGGSALQAENVSGFVHKAVGVPYTFNYITLS